MIAVILHTIINNLPPYILSLPLAEGFYGWFPLCSLVGPEIIYNEDQIQMHFVTVNAKHRLA